MATLRDQVIGDQYAIYLGDCCEIMPTLPAESIGLSLYSPPFGGMLYQYSSDPNDLSNTKNYAEFFEHYGFVVREIHRLTMPGRMTAVHCQDIAYTRGTDHYLIDFSGDLIRAHEANGWKYVARYHVWKEPLLVRNRTMVSSLHHKTMTEDSTKCSMANADYLLIFRRSGQNAIPVDHPIGLTSYAGWREPPETVLKWRGYKGNQIKNEYSQWVWRQYASSNWDDVRIDRVLPYRAAREEDDEKHCLAAGSLVLTRTGYRPIETVNIGDEVLTHLGRWKSVVVKRMNGVREVVQVKAQGVPYLRLTSDHLLWHRSGFGLGGGRGNRWKPGSSFHPRANAVKRSPEWIQASETKSHYLNLPLPPIEYSALSEGDWWIIGRWLGDGHLDARGYPHISCSTKEVAALVATLGWRAGHVRQSNRSTMSVAVKDAVPVSGVASGRRTTAFTEMLKKCGRGAAGKQLPPEAFALEPVKAESLLAGYLSADGHFVSRYQRWMASSVSRGLLLGMAILAQRSRGVVASVYAGRAPGRKIIEGLDCNTLQDWVMSIPPRNISGMILDDGAWKKVRDVQASGCEEVWDLEVEEDHSYVAEGCVVHNCHPLQLDVIERAVIMWSNPGEVVLTPFMGVGSEVYGSVLNGRKAIGIELKKSYFNQANRNLELLADTRAAEVAIGTPNNAAADLFSGMGIE